MIQLDGLGEVGGGGLELSQLGKEKRSIAVEGTVVGRGGDALVD